MKKIILIILSFIFLVIIVASYISLKPQKIFIPEGTKDCGSEKNIFKNGINISMRTCFVESFRTCSPAKIYQRESTIEGDPITKIAVIEGIIDNKCNVHAYIDSKDRFGSWGKSDTICHNIKLEYNNRLIIDECYNNKSYSY